MCLAIYAPVGVQLSRERLSNGWDSNSDGAGYAFIDQYGGIRCRRFENWYDFIEGYQADHAANTKSPFIVHERFATHGTTDLSNVHPFWMDDETVVMHNGVLKVNLTDKERSDTKTFVEDYLAKLPKRWFDDPNMVEMVEDFTRGSKLIILTSDPLAKQEVYIINEDDGHWDRGAWWSNYTYRGYKFSSWGGYGHSVKAGASVSTKSAEESAKTFTSTVKDDGEHIAGWSDQDDMPDMPPVTDDDLRWGEVSCYLCEKTTHEGPVCFTCEYCTECMDEFWKCKHVNDMTIADAYIYWVQSYTDALIAEEEKTGQLEVVTDPDVIDKVTRA